eukprot:2068954-Rhodomonas_salina.1
MDPTTCSNDNITMTISNRIAGGLKKVPGHPVPGYPGTAFLDNRDLAPGYPGYPCPRVRIASNSGMCNKSRLLVSVRGRMLRPTLATVGPNRCKVTRAPPVESSQWRNHSPTIALAVATSVRFGSFGTEFNRGEPLVTVHETTLKRAGFVLEL